MQDVSDTVRTQRLCSRVPEPDGEVVRRAARIAVAACIVGRASEIPMFDARCRAMCMQTFVEDVWKQGRDVSNVDRLVTNLDIGSRVHLMFCVTSLGRSVRTDECDADTCQ